VSHGGTVNKAQIGLQYLNTLTPWNGRGGFALDGIIGVLKRLGQPQDSYPTVHIAGTNGKGSVSASIASILGAAGFKVGLNSSPHLQILNERIVINGLPIDDNSLGEFCYDVRAAASRDLVELSFHEAITAVSFLAFREMGLDWGVIEVGLGGRLDASNVISRPAATAIVTIDYDHQAILGNSLAEIASEKAGIIKQGSPLVSGLLPPEAERVVNEKARGTKHYRYRTDYGVAPEESGEPNTFGYWGKDFPIAPITSFDFTSPLPGIHQGHNLSVAATLALAIGMTPEVVKEGIEGVYWPARLESVVVDGCSILMDCAHNQAGIRAFIDYLLRTQAGQIDLTFGVLDTKNWKEMITMLNPHVRHWRLIKPDSDRALPLEHVQAEIRLSGNDVKISAYGSDYNALVKGMLRESEGQTFYVTGSMYMIGRLRSIFGMPIKPLWNVNNRTAG
jgi:dihydrofolate synthase/folylpolyglutamate synthase